MYIYWFAAGKPKLLAYFNASGRAYSGLYKVFGDHGKLVIELFDPEKGSGGCWSGLVRTRYGWQHKRFAPIGPAERETLEELTGESAATCLRKWCRV